MQRALTVVTAPEGFGKHWLEFYTQDEETLPSATRHQSLSRMEHEILKQINHGLTNQPLGEKHGITVSTTKWYLTQMFSKLNAYLRFVIERIAEHPVNRVADLLPWAVATQIVSPSAVS